MLQECEQWRKDFGVDDIVKSVAAHPRYRHVSYRLVGTLISRKGRRSTNTILHTTTRPTRYILQSYAYISSFRSRMAAQFTLNDWACLISKPCTPSRLKNASYSVLSWSTKSSSTTAFPHVPNNVVTPLKRHAPSLISTTSLSVISIRSRTTSARHHLSVKTVIPRPWANSTSSTRPGHSTPFGG